MRKSKSSAMASESKTKKSTVSSKMELRCYVGKDTYYFFGLICYRFHLNKRIERFTFFLSSAPRIQMLNSWQFFNFAKMALLNRFTEVRFASFLSGGFTTMSVMNPPEKKLEKRTSVRWLVGLCCKKAACG